MRRIVILAALAAAAHFPPGAWPTCWNCVADPALELCVNGSFEEPLEVGWQATLPDTASTVTRDTGYEPDPDYEVRLLKDHLTGSARLDQLLPFPGIDTHLSVRGQLWSESGSVSWAAAAIVIAFVDDGGFTLGQTAFYSASRWCPWENRPDFHIIEVAAGVWDTYTLDVAAELTMHLPAVDPDAVHSLRLSLWTVLDDC